MAINVPWTERLRRATEKRYAESLRFFEALEYNRGRDLSDLRSVPPERRYAHIAKPWKGRAGRAAIRRAGTTTARKLDRRALTARLRAERTTYAAIAERLGVSVRTVRRDLGGR